MKIRSFLSVPFVVVPAIALEKDLHSLLRRGLIKVGKNRCPASQPECDPRGISIEECSNANSLQNACKNGPNKADFCTYFPGFTEYECECEDGNDACSTMNAACLTNKGYALERVDQGNGGGSVGGNGDFYACNCIDSSKCPV